MTLCRKASRFLCHVMLMVSMIGCVLQKHSAQGCLSVDSSQLCSTIQQHECYKDTIAASCTSTCSSYADKKLPDCLYGDRNPSICENIVISDCYNATTKNACCGTCAGVRNDKNPNCLYGNKDSHFCRSVTRQACYKNETHNICCDTCIELMNNALPGCTFGNREDCPNVNILTCSNRTIQEQCCETCFYLQDNACPKDELPWCSTIQASECYDSITRKACCYTCLGYYLGYANLPGPDNCTYGDHTPSKCINATQQDCYMTSSDCCYKCSYYELKDMPVSCRYGDKASNCSTLATFECYNATKASMCCGTCASYNQTAELGVDCSYGDRTDKCYTRKPSTCYINTSKAECCKFCQLVAETSLLGCEYCDSSDDCQAANCSSYGQERLKNCCYTCQNYQQTSPVAPIQPNSTTSSTMTNPTVTRSEFTKPETNPSVSSSMITKPVTKPTALLPTLSSSTVILTILTTTRSTTTHPANTTTTTEFQNRISSTDNEQKSSIVGGVVGGIVGGVILVAAIIAICLLIRNRNTAMKKYQECELEEPFHIYTEPMLNPNNGTTRDAGSQSSHIMSTAAQLRRAPLKPQLKKQKSEDVYTYINPDDIRTVLTEPYAVSSPALPARPISGMSTKLAGTSGVLQQMSNGTGCMFTRNTSVDHCGDVGTKIFSIHV